MQSEVLDRWPVRVTAELSPELGRWKWLAKWFLAIPHLVVLTFLWIAFAFLTFAAGVSIAFTGRYPRGIFDFNVGVMRWTWRVQLYAFTLTTDQYPPFSMQPDADFPATLDVDYPEHLSRPPVPPTPPLSPRRSRCSRTPTSRRRSTSTTRSTCHAVSCG